jgi:hypothetical protein
MLLGLLLLTAGVDDPDPPTVFELGQNTPDPFCPGTAGGHTEIQMALPQEAAVLLEIWNTDTTLTLRTLVDGVLAAGYHSVVWDGRDGGGSVPPEGEYVYAMTATEVGTGDLLYYAALTATIDCTVRIQPIFWGKVKAGFGQ